LPHASAQSTDTSQSSNDVATRAKELEARNAALERENAALRERVKLAEENAKLNGRLRQLDGRGQGAESTSIGSAPSPQLASSSKMRSALNAHYALHDDASLSMANGIAVAPSWTGFYAGFNIGYGWANSSVDFSPNDPVSAFLFGTLEKGQPPSTPISTSGVLGGFQVGYNWEIKENWLVGAETDFNWPAMNGSGSRSGNAGFLVPFPYTSNVDEQTDWFGTVRTRLGYIPINNLLAYITGGFAYGRVARQGIYNSNTAATFSIPPFSAVCATGAACFTGSSIDVDIGWTAGGGFEYALSPGVSFRAEYLYISLNGKSLTETAVNGGGAIPSTFNANYGHTDFNLARLGLNFRL
jgi:outer membrane immunogenic protein